MEVDETLLVDVWDDYAPEAAAVVIFIFLFSLVVVS